MIAGAGLLGDVDHEHGHVGFAERGDGRIDHALIHAVRGFVNAGGVEKRDLPAGDVGHTQNPLARRLRLVGRDRDLVADQRVHERRFSGVRPADERNVARFHGPWADLKVRPDGRRSGGSSDPPVRRNAAE